MGAKIQTLLLSEDAGTCSSFFLYRTKSNIAIIGDGLICLQMLCKQRDVSQQTRLIYVCARVRAVQQKHYAQKPSTLSLMFVC